MKFAPPFLSCTGADPSGALVEAQDPALDAEVRLLVQPDLPGRKPARAGRRRTPRVEMETRPRKDQGNAPALGTFQAKQENTKGDLADLQMYMDPQARDS